MRQSAGSGVCSKICWAGQAAEERADQEESTGELRKLQRLVSSPRVTLVQLERQLGTLTDLGQTLPEELADRVAGCRARLLRHARLQRWLRFGAAGLLLVVFLVLLVMFLF